MKKYFVGIVCLFLGLHISFGQGENLFDDTYLHEIYFSSMDTSLIDGSKVYQMVDMTIDGMLVDSIGIKEKGNLSNNVPFLKVPFKIKTNKYVSGKKYDGIAEFTLHNSYQDPSMMREKITYDICEQMGLIALRTAYAKVYIEGKYWGLYTLVEGKDEMFKLRFGNRDADAIESLDLGNMCFISNNPDDYNADITGLPRYQLENGDANTAFPRFARMINKANNTSDADYLDTVSSYLNLKDFFTYQAVNVYLMNMDSYIAFQGNQIFMYDTIQQRFQVIPWDFNASLGLWDTNNSSPDSYPMVPPTISSGCIASKMNTLPKLRTYYFDAMCLLSNEILDTTRIYSIIDSWKSQIKQAVYDDYRKTFTNQDFDLALEKGYYQHNFENVPALKTFFSERFKLISLSLADSAYTCTSTAIPEFLPDDIVRIYPNPAFSEIFIESDFSFNRIQIMNISGKLFIDKTLSIPKEPINISQLPAGIYIAILSSDSKSVSKKIVIH